MSQPPAKRRRISTQTQCLITRYFSPVTDPEAKKWMVRRTMMFAGWDRQGVFSHAILPRGGPNYNTVWQEDHTSPRSYTSLTLQDRYISLTWTHYPGHLNITVSIERNSRDRTLSFEREINGDFAKALYDVAAEVYEWAHSPNPLCPLCLSCYNDKLDGVKLERCLQCVRHINATPCPGCNNSDGVRLKRGKKSGWHPGCA